MSVDNCASVAKQPLLSKVLVSRRVSITPAYQRSLTDYTLRVGSGHSAVEFPVHKIFLSLESEYFAALFTDETRNNSAGEFMLVDDPKLVKDMLSLHGNIARRIPSQCKRSALLLYGSISFSAGYPN